MGAGSTGQYLAGILSCGRVVSGSARSEATVGTKSLQASDAKAPALNDCFFLSRRAGLPLFPGKKLTIALEELGLPYTFHKVTFDHVKDPWFTKISPNGKIPAIAVNAPAEGEDGTPELTLMESGAIMAYLGKLAGGKLMGEGDPIAEAKVNQWLFWVNAGVGALSWPFGLSRGAPLCLRASVGEAWGVVPAGHGLGSLDATCFKVLTPSC